jgi:hypothetical protein
MDDIDVIVVVMGKSMEVSRLARRLGSKHHLDVAGLTLA